MKPVLTVFTPTYNRAYTLHLCYESLKAQTCKDFIWLIIDDGSTDNTKELVQRWSAEGIVPIHYYWQENQGMHGAHNTAYGMIDTELNVCIDSDDYMPADAVEKMISCWRQYGGNDVSGIVGLNAGRDGRILGTRMPAGIARATLNELYSKYRARGDKKLVYRSELTRRFPYPLFEGEKFVPLGYKYFMLDQEYKLILLDEVLCFVEYMADGSSRNIFRQYKNNPRGFIFNRKVRMSISTNPVEKFRESVHYVSSSFMIRNKHFLKESPCRWITFLATIPGILLFIYIMKTCKRGFSG